MASEKRLIDANALCDLLDAEYKRKMELVRKGEAHLDTLAEGIMSMAIVVGTMPTVDAVEVVRCEKCKHWGYHGGYGYFCNHPKSMRFKSKKDDFCSYGERKDNERKAD